MVLFSFKGISKKGLFILCIFCGRTYKYVFFCCFFMFFWFVCLVRLGYFRLGYFRLGYFRLGEVRLVITLHNSYFNLLIDCKFEAVRTYSGYGMATRIYNNLLNLILGTVMFLRSS